VPSNQVSAQGPQVAAHQIARPEAPLYYDSEDQQESLDSTSGSSGVFHRDRSLTAAITRNFPAKTKTEKAG
jgi:hypothetical protein